MRRAIVVLVFVALVALSAPAAFAAGCRARAS
jgi:hypothetical protein